MGSALELSSGRAPSCTNLLIQLELTRNWVRSFMVELRVAPPVQQRIDTLAERANDGVLTSDEAAEYEALINAADFISIL